MELTTDEKKKQVRNFAYKMFQEYDLDGWLFKFSDRKRAVGDCNLGTKVIRISTEYIPYVSLEELEDVVMHEICHALLPIDEGHGKRFKALAKKLGVVEKPINAPIKNKFIGVCPKCGREVQGNRRTRISCGKCDPKYNSKYAFVWSRIS